jgi:heat shock protein HslJ
MASIAILVRRSGATALAAVATLGAPACGWNDAVDSRSATAGLPTIRQDLEEHEWLLERGDSSLTVDDDNPVTLSVSGDDVSGMAPCNAYRATFDLGGDLGDGGVDISDIVLTRRACEASTMRAEDEFVAALEAVDQVSVDEDDDRMTMTGDDDAVRLTFGSYDAEELLATTWDIVSVNTGDAIESVLPGTEPTVTFESGDEAGGDVILETGCNTAAGSWELDGHELSVDRLRITLKECLEPEGVMDQEAALVRGLEAADRVEIVPGELTVLDADGSITLVAVQR